MKSLIMQQSLELEEKLILLLEQEDVRWGDRERNEIGINWGETKLSSSFMHVPAKEGKKEFD